MRIRPLQHLPANLCASLRKAKHIEQSATDRKGRKTHFTTPLKVKSITVENGLIDSGIEMICQQL